ncbi:hypothetical protein, partial [Streptomyces sp. NPDC096323]|uniref:hypothetical protein n=1 Tax=Streptomyces sp. NPDC096323 TaxID=3155822 RepID=UPI00332E5EB5
MPVFVQGSGEAGEWRHSTPFEIVQPGWQGCRVAVFEHGGEAADQVVSELEFGAVFEEPGQALVDVRAAAVRTGEWSDPRNSDTWTLDVSSSRGSDPRWQS